MNTFLDVTDINARIQRRAQIKRAAIVLLYCAACILGGYVMAISCQ